MTEIKHFFFSFVFSICIFFFFRAIMKFHFYRLCSLFLFLLYFVAIERCWSCRGRRWSSSTLYFFSRLLFGVSSFIQVRSIEIYTHLCRFWCVFCFGRHRHVHGGPATGEKRTCDEKKNTIQTVGRWKNTRKMRIFFCFGMDRLFYTLIM